MALKYIPLLLAISALKCAYQHYWLQSTFICWPTFQVLFPESDTFAEIALTSIAMTLPISICLANIQLQADFNPNYVIHAWEGT